MHRPAANSVLLRYPGQAKSPAGKRASVLEESMLGDHSVNAGGGSNDAPPVQQAPVAGFPCLAAALKQGSASLP